MWPSDFLQFYDDLLPTGEGCLPLEGRNATSDVASSVDTVSNTQNTQWKVQILLKALFLMLPSRQKHNSVTAIATSTWITPHNDKSFSTHTICNFTLLQRQNWIVGITCIIVHVKTWLPCNCSSILVLGNSALWYHHGPHWYGKMCIAVNPCNLKNDFYYRPIYAFITKYATGNWFQCRVIFHIWHARQRWYFTHCSESCNVFTLAGTCHDLVLLGCAALAEQARFLDGVRPWVTNQVPLHVPAWCAWGAGWM